MTPQTTTTTKQKLLLLATGLLAVVVLIGLVEWILARAGVGENARFADPYVGFSASTSVFERAAGPEGDHWRTRPEKLPFFNAQQFPATKPPGSLRVVTLGGSTTAGRPYDDHVSFSRWLERFLRLAEPDRGHQVINAGAISYASYRVTRVLGEMLDHEPDLFVVLTGHNEFLEERTYREVRAEPGARRWVRSHLARLRLVRWVWSELDEPSPPEAIGPHAASALLAGDVQTRLEVWNGVQAYRRDDVQRDAIIEHFRFHLDAMVDLARSRNVPIVFVAPASNLKDFSPFKSQHAADLSPSDAARIDRMLRTAATLPNEGQTLGVLQQAVEEDPLFAESWYRLGQAQVAAGEADAGFASLVEARQQDVAPLRAPSEMVEAIRALTPSAGVPVIDLPRVLQAQQFARLGHRIPGAEQFLDHVHPTLEVHRGIAELLLTWMEDQHLVAASERSERDKLFQTIVGSLDAEYYARRDLNLAKVLGWAGKLAEAEAPLLRARQVLDREPAVHLALGTLWQKTGRPAAARVELRKAVELSPDLPEGHFNLAVVEARLGRPAEAQQHFERALDLRPDYPEALFNLAQVLRHEERWEEAIDRLEAARLRSPNEVRVIRALAITYRESGRYAQAEALLTQALDRGDPTDDSAELLLELASHQAERGELADARALLGRVLATSPERVEAHYLLGRLSATEGDQETAAIAYLQALKLDATHVPTLNNLGILRAGQGRQADAAELLRRAIRLDPSYAEAHLNLAVVLDQSGRPGEALQSALEAVALRPNEARIQLAVGMLFLAAGRVDEARPHLSAARAAGLQLPPPVAAVLGPED